MKYIWWYLCLFIIHPSFAQTTINVQAFSKDYHARIYLNNPDEVFSPGWIAVYDSHTNKELIKVESEELALSLHDGQAIANVKELPYGEQSLVMYEDFNFDGIKDFAIENGQNSCYHGPSFVIYLGSKKGFAYSDAFSRLAQEYCGMFSIDAATKRIQTMTKSGCCWHQFSEFVVENNAPKAVKIIEEDLMRFPFGTITTQTWNGTRMVTTAEEILDTSAIKTLYAFTLEKNGKMALLFTLDDDLLHYALLRPGGQLEFTYPAGAEPAQERFNLTTINGHTLLSFRNKNAEYRIADADHCSITVTVKGNNTLINGNAGSARGNLKQLLKANLLNLNKP